MHCTIKSFVERETQILAWCKGKRVLHLGCVGTTDYETEAKVNSAGESLHARLTAVSDCIGVDLDAAAVEALTARGVFDNLVVGDVERLHEVAGTLGTFDVVVAGDIIEHLSNPGLMLDGIEPLLRVGGSLIVSTPNAFGLPNFVRNMIGSFREGLQHVLVFNNQTLTQLLERHGYEVAEAFTCYQGKTRRGLAFAVGRMAIGIFPRVGGTLLVRCTVRRSPG